MGEGSSAALRPEPEGRREAVLDAALETFARFGYRKTSMDDVAADARISRPGLYFLFSSKGALFRAAIERAIELDLAVAQQALVALDRPLVDRVVEAFDHWAGRYVGPMGDVQTLVSENPNLLGPVAAAGPDRFQRMLDDALRDVVDDPGAVVRTLISVSIGVKHQAADRAEYLERLRTAAALLLDPIGRSAPRD